MRVREIKFNDIDEVWELLNQLKFVETSLVDKEKAWKNFNGEGFVVESANKIIGFGSLIVERKIRGYNSAQIEDVVIDEEFRGIGVGELLIRKMVDKAWEMRCYRISLFCKEELISFYTKNGFKVNNVVMKQWME
jgi:N-acetylglutamate synthase-like GNAT family acetyltransferase